MDRLIAIKILKELQIRIPELAPQEVTLLEAGDSYGLHFKGLCEGCRRQVIAIANEQGLLIEEQKNELTITDKKKVSNTVTEFPY